MGILAESASTVGVWSNIHTAMAGPERSAAVREGQWSRVTGISDSDEKLIQNEGQCLSRKNLAQSQVVPLTTGKRTTTDVAGGITGIAQRLSGVLLLLSGTSLANGLQHGGAGVPASFPRLPDNCSDVLQCSGAAVGAVQPQPFTPLLVPERIEEKNQYVINFLRENDDRIFPEQQAISSHSLLRAAVACLISDPQAERQLSRHILKDQHEADAEMSAPERSGSTTLPWLAGLLFKDGIEAFVVTHLREAQSDAEWTSTHLHDAFRQAIYAAVLTGEAEQEGAVPDAAVAHFIFEKVIYQAAPALRYARDGVWTDLKQLEWGKVNAGLLWAQRSGVDISTFSEAEALALGSMLLVAIADDHMPEEMQDLFVLAAQSHAVQAGHDSDSDIPYRGALLKAYFAFNEQFTDAHCPLAKFTRLQQNFLSRTEMAQRRVDLECPQMSVTNLLNTDDSALCLYPYTTDLGKYLLRPTAKWLSGYVLSERLFIRSVNADYQQQVDDLAAAYATLDRILSFVALSELGEQEVRFIDQAQLQRMQASFDARHTIRGQPAARNQPLQRQMKVGLAADVEIYAAIHDGEERIYVLRRTKSGYEASRIDRNVDEYLELAEDSRPHNDPDYQLKINASGKPLAAKTGGMLNELLQQTSQEHRALFAKQMHALGFDATTMQHVEAFILSLLPFYTCVSEIGKGSHDAILACAFDGMFLFSTIGNVGRAALKASDPALRAGLMALRSTTGEVAARHAMKAGNVVRPSLTSLPRSANSGLVPTVDAGMTELDRMLNLGEGLKNYLPALDTALPKLSFVQKVSIIRRQGLSGGHGHPEQSVTNVRPPEHAGSSMWSARGPTEILEVSAGLLRQLQGKKITQLELAKIAREHSVNVNALNHHMMPDGQLTPLGQSVLDQANSLMARQAVASVGAGAELEVRFADEIAEWLSLDLKQRNEIGGISGFSYRHQIDALSFEQALSHRNLKVHFDDEIAEWLSLDSRQRKEIGGISGFSYKHQIDPVSFEWALAESNPLPPVPKKVPHESVTATLLRDWQVWMTRYGASTDSVVKFFNGRQYSATSWSRHVNKDGSLTPLGQNLLASLT